MSNRPIHKVAFVWDCDTFGVWEKNTIRVPGGKYFWKNISHAKLALADSSLEKRPKHYIIYEVPLLGIMALLKSVETEDNKDEVYDKVI